MASEQDLSSLKIATETLHVTLMVMNLPTLFEIDQASKCLEKVVPVYMEKHNDQPRFVEFEKLSDFNRGQVLFACIKSPGNDVLQLLADEVKRHMKECGIESTGPEDKPFNPHLTLMKYKWKKSKGSKGPKKIERSWYEDLAEEYLGCQSIVSLQLCQMEKKGDDGYYFVAHEVPFKS